jgi:non-heme chloroperoxidase
MRKKPLSTSEKSLIVNGLTISYDDVNESKEDIIFFIHGNSQSRNIWDVQLHASQFANYRLIAFDLPGHGQSSASDNKFYDYSVIGCRNIKQGRSLS